MTYKLTAQEIREIVAASGLSHAGFVLEQAESQLGAENLKEARAEWERLLDEEFLTEHDDEVSEAEADFPAPYVVSL
jgi:hypothetical protein